MKFVLFVEGYTEKKAIASFLKRWLDPRLDQPVGIQTVRFDGWAEMIKDIPRKVSMYLNGPQTGQIIAAIALMDLYGPNFYPHHLDSPETRLSWAKAEIEKRVGDERFRLYFAVHELEAWLLSNPTMFPKEVGNRFPANIQQPEEIDFEEPPAELLNRLYRQYAGRGYRKIVDGQDLFQRLNPEVVYQKCPNFAKMVDELLGLAREFG